jgi:hypothetical protein
VATLRGALAGVWACVHAAIPSISAGRIAIFVFKLRHS